MLFCKHLTQINQLNGHSRQINDIIQLNNNNYLVSASDDSTLKVWNNEYSNIYTLKGHSNNVYSIVELSTNRMASCSKDKSIIIWNTNYENKITNMVIIMINMFY